MALKKQENKSNKAKQNKRSFALKIKAAIGYCGLTQTDVSNLIQMNRSNFQHRMANDTFNIEEIDKIAKALDAQFNFNFEFKDGTKI